MWWLSEEVGFSYRLKIFYKSQITGVEIFFQLYEFRINWLIDLVGRVFAIGTGDLGSIPGRVIPQSLKMVLDIFLLNTHKYKVRIKGKVEQSRERSSALLYSSV